MYAIRSYYELFTTISHCKIGATDIIPENICKLDQYVVSLQVAVLIIKLFKMININQNDGERCLISQVIGS